MLECRCEQRKMDQTRVLISSLPTRRTSTAGKKEEILQVSSLDDIQVTR